MPGHIFAVGTTQLGLEQPAVLLVLSCCKPVTLRWDSGGHAVGSCKSEEQPSMARGHPGTSTPPHQSCPPTAGRARCCPLRPREWFWCLHQWVQDLAPGHGGAAPMGAPGSAPSFPPRAAIPLYDADTGLLVLAEKVRSHSSGVQQGVVGCSEAQQNTEGCRGAQSGACGGSAVQQGAEECSRVQVGVGGCRELHWGAGVTVRCRRVQRDVARCSGVQGDAVGCSPLPHSGPIPSASLAGRKPPVLLGGGTCAASTHSG